MEKGDRACPAHLIVTDTLQVPLASVDRRLVVPISSGPRLSRKYMPVGEATADPTANIFDEVLKHKHSLALAVDS